MNNIAHAGTIYCAIYVTLDCFLGLDFKGIVGNEKYGGQDVDES
jgi:hypothetical protein